MKTLPIVTWKGWEASLLLLLIERRTDACFSHDIQMKRIFQELEVNLALDVGAHVGDFAQYLRSIYSGEIISFEPVSSLFDKLATAASSDPSWHVHKLEVESQESTQLINVSNLLTFGSLLIANDYCVQRFGIGARGTKTEVVSVRRLDELLDEIVPGMESKRIFPKIDTQGYDVEVFRASEINSSM